MVLCGLRRRRKLTTPQQNEILIFRRFSYTDSLARVRVVKYSTQVGSKGATQLLCLRAATHIPRSAVDPAGRIVAPDVIKNVRGTSFGPLAPEPSPYQQ